jgi:trimeric autotransporter adhesin
VITTVAGNGQMGFSGDGGPATSAMLNYPWALALDAAGNLFIADGLNNRIRKVSPGGIITTVVGGGYTSGVNETSATSVAVLPLGLAVDQGGTLYFSDPAPRIEADECRHGSYGRR